MEADATCTLADNTAYYGANIGGYPVRIAEKTSVTEADYAYLGTLSSGVATRLLSRYKTKAIILILFLKKFPTAQHCQHKISQALH
jgi:hypothetical protein